MKTTTRNNLKTTATIIGLVGAMSVAGAAANDAGATEPPQGLCASYALQDRDTNPDTVSFRESVIGDVALYRYTKTWEQVWYRYYPDLTVLEETHRPGEYALVIEGFQGGRDERCYRAAPPPLVTPTPRQSTPIISTPGVPAVPTQVVWNIGTARTNPRTLRVARARKTVTRRRARWGTSVTFTIRAKLRGNTRGRLVLTDRLNTDAFIPTRRQARGVTQRQGVMRRVIRDARPGRWYTMRVRVVLVGSGCNRATVGVRGDARDTNPACVRVTGLPRPRSGGVAG